MTAPSRAQPSRAELMHLLECLQDQVEELAASVKHLQDVLRRDEP